MLTTLLYASVSLVTICYLSDWLFGLWDHPSEPPRAQSKLPLIGHLLGLIKLGTSHYTQVSREQHSEVYTIGVFNYKLYIINSRRLIPLVQRLSKTLSFTPFQQTAAKAFINCSDFTVDLHAKPEFMRDFDKMQRTSLAPGPHLDYQNLRTVNSLKESLDQLLSGTSGDRLVRVPFYKWSRKVITLAATSGIWGDSNPFFDPKIEEAFWTWNDGIPSLLLGLGIAVPRSMKARQDLINSFKNYYSGDYQDAAEIIKRRMDLLTRHGVSEDDIVRLSVNFNIGLLSNTAPTGFWTLYNVFSQPELLQELRAEIEEIAVTRNGDNSYELDLAAIKTKCPHLLSAFEETQRTLTIHANIRKVLEDTTLDKFRLKKGNFVQIPNAPIHHDTELWGSDADDFNSRRFVKSDGTTLSASSVPTNGFLAWGTAPHLCPARQFASTEILAMMALMLLRIEIEPVGEKWKRPEPKIGELAAILPPKKDIEVEIRPRKGWSGEWVLKMGGSSTAKVSLASG